MPIAVHRLNKSLRDLMSNGGHLDSKSNLEAEQKPGSATTDLWH